MAPTASSVPTAFIGEGEEIEQRGWAPVGWAPVVGRAFTYGTGGMHVWCEWETWGWMEVDVCVCDGVCLQHAHPKYTHTDNYLESDK